MSYLDARGSQIEIVATICQTKHLAFSINGRDRHDRFVSCWIFRPSHRTTIPRCSDDNDLLTYDSLERDFQ